LSPQLVTFNGNSFDLPVLRYRAMVHGVSAPGLSARPYFHRYTEDAVDLCDVFSSFSPHGKASLHEISRVMGLPGKPKGFDGSEVERYNFVGYDVLSRLTSTDPTPLPIEVKGSERRPKEADFVITRNEFRTAQGSETYTFHLWYVSRPPQLFVVPFER